VNKVCGFIVGTNYRDGIWFQSVSASAFKTFPFRMPNFSGALLSGYHYLPNLIAYLLSRLGIPIAVSYYKLFPFLYMIFLTALSIIFARKIKNNSLFVALFLFFSFFGIPLTLITSLHYYGFIKNSLLINTFQSTRILESMHFAFSLIILLVVLILLNKKVLKLKEKIIIGILVFLIFGIKFYVAAIMLFMLVLNETLVYIQAKKFKEYLISLFIYGTAAFISILIFYNPFSAVKGGSIFVFAPFATVHHMIENESMFYLPNLVLARYFLYAHGVSPRLIAIELFSTFLFVVFYFGARALGFLYIAKQIIIRKISRFEFVLTSGIVLGIILAIMFVQKGDWFNPMQFAVVSAFLMNIFSAQFMFELFQRQKMLAIVLGLIVFVLTFVPNLINLGYLSDKARLVIPQEEMRALEVLKKLPDGTVFFPIIDPNVDLTYVSAFTGKQTYVNFVTLLQTTSVPYQKRFEETKDANTIDVDSLDIRYAYIPKEYKDYDVLVKKFEESKRYRELLRNEKVSLFELKVWDILPEAKPRTIRPRRTGTGVIVFEKI
jgi:hypothetical protein